jgi:calcineurin-like phosphoesterase family protein
MSFTKKFFTSDTHFNHARVIELCARPFRDVQHMDEEMILRWNRVVGENDIVFHLGDFAFGLGDVERVRGIFFRLNGRKRLIIGNHDVDKKGNLHRTLADLPWDAPPVAACETSDEGKRVYLCHYAARTWPAAHHGAYHFYGHSHGALPGIGLSRDIGVDMPDVGFAPRTFKELTANMPKEA